MSKELKVEGARVHNLKNIDVTIPHGTLTVITGLSGSGKSSLAFDTIHAEGQRRYIETFSSYVRNMLGNLERPDVDNITGLSPVIAIEQKTVNRNPRSTVGTTTEVYDFLRLLYARAGEAVSYLTGKPMVSYTPKEILQLVKERHNGRKIYLMAPLIKGRKGIYRDLFTTLRKQGFLSVLVDGELRDLDEDIRLDRYKTHNIDLVIDRLKMGPNMEERLSESIATAMERGGGQVIVYDADTKTPTYYSRNQMDPETGLSYREPSPANFSFNSPQGACKRCNGLGYITVVDIDKIIPDRSKSIAQGGIVPLGKEKGTKIFWQIGCVLERHHATLKTPIDELTPEALHDVLYGTTERLPHRYESIFSSLMGPYEGVMKMIEEQREEEAAEGTVKSKTKANALFKHEVCPECHGDRLNREALHYFIDGKNIADLSHLDISDLLDWVNTVEQRMTHRQQVIAAEILKEVRSRLEFLKGVGLDYLSLNRQTATLSGGESQRIRLATQLGSRLVNVLYILDEPSIGLHPKDNTRLIQSLKGLRDAENTVIVVEHDREVMEQADYIVDIGPGAGRKGGYVVYNGEAQGMLKSQTLTSEYLSRRKDIALPVLRRAGNGKHLILKGATGHNLKDVTIDLPLGTLTCVAGVSGSGKSSLINATLLRALSTTLYHSHKEPLPYKEIIGLENIDKVVTVDQSPLGRTPRSNPATYTGLFTDIRNLFVDLPEAKIRGYKPGRFSFNVGGGRCETCGGNGYKTIEMNFLPDVLVPCETCHGKRYNRETLEVRYKGKSIADILDMTIDTAVEFFKAIPNISRKLQTLQSVGLGYIKLGQPSSTLSGGENQRVKLASELAKRDTGKTLFILDEPTTGLHFEDINTLVTLFNKLVDRGNTVLVIEHNLDVLKVADHIIDMGPGGGRNGGHIITTGTPEEVAKTDSPTANYLREELAASKHATK